MPQGAACQSSAGFSPCRHRARDSCLPVFGRLLTLLTSRPGELPASPLQASHPADIDQRELSVSPLQAIQPADIVPERAACQSSAGFSPCRLRARESCLPVLCRLLTLPTSCPGELPASPLQASHPADFVPERAACQSSAGFSPCRLRALGNCLPVLCRLFNLPTSCQRELPASPLQASHLADFVLWGTACQSSAGFSPCRLRARGAACQSSAGFLSCRHRASESCLQVPCRLLTLPTPCPGELPASFCRLLTLPTSCPGKLLANHLQASHPLQNAWNLPSDLNSATRLKIHVPGRYACLCFGLHACVQEYEASPACQPSRLQVYVTGEPSFHLRIFVQRVSRLTRLNIIGKMDTWPYSSCLPVFSAMHLNSQGLRACLSFCLPAHLKVEYEPG
ncbi:uncharacterized protein LOC123874786 [Maniola jurtina]|uniref:uncharacterized protein LOC123874786 n=1 Tax=Maniola jurtina TaxID=191418 RepID=UPI001E68B3C7|nr:uncharacterized protein LOC123874786 [Maniola jurtina]